MFLAETRERINFTKFTLDLLGYQGSRSYPKGHWSKSMDTATVSKFIEHLCAQHAHEFPSDRCLGLIYEGCSAIQHFFHVVFSASYFLTESEGWQVISAGHAFLLSYARAAEQAYKQSLCLFALKPVLHLFAHIVLTALQQYKMDPECVVNPVAESTFMSEDLVGRVSRLSRRVSAKKHGLKIMYRYSVAVHFHLHNPEGLNF